MKRNFRSKSLMFCLMAVFLLSGCTGTGKEAGNAGSSPTKNNQKPTMKYLGRASVKIKTSKGTVIYIDPYAGNDYEEAADIVLITHEHEDHNNVSLIKDISKASIIRAKDSIVDGKYKSFQVKDTKIEAVAAYNQNHSKNECVGYILEFDGIKLYHAGDTSKIEEMNNLASRKLNYALLPIDGKYNMGPLEAMECAKIINAKYNIPIHSSGSDNYNQENVDKFKPQNVIPVKEGDVIPLVQ